MFSDKTLTCRDCGASFLFTAGEQDFYRSKGFTNDPGRCFDCRQKRLQKAKSGELELGYQPEEKYNSKITSITSIKCANCGRETTIPFKPVFARPVYCKACYQQLRKNPPASTDKTSTEPENPEEEVVGTEIPKMAQISLKSN
ncbi:MAG TPA: zinc-ribbon domain containing protein [Chloroflexia bacterium]|nr:zinc-ribbon domain containing protein [Chloroflexia bacterium]